MSGTKTIDSGVRIGHVHLKVADLERALAFYCGVLGFTLTQRYGSQAAFVAAGGYHHHIGLNTWESRGGAPPALGTTGLFHAAILYPTRAALADALQTPIIAASADTPQTPIFAAPAEAPQTPIIAAPAEAPQTPIIAAPAGCCAMSPP